MQEDDYLSRKRTGAIPMDWGDRDAVSGIVAPESIAHDYFLLQSLPDFLVTKPGQFDLFNILYNKRREQGGWYDPIRILSFMTYVQMANGLEPGAYGEFGVADGTSASYIYKVMEEGSALYLFDTFSGFDEGDVAIENRLFDKNIERDMLVETTKDAVRANVLSAFGERDVDLRLVEGLVPASFEPFGDVKFRFVSIDMDLYQPTAGLLELLWDQMVPGGILQFHDYGCSLFPGIPKAVDEFFIPRGITPVPLPDRTVSAIVIKPRAVG